VTADASGNLFGTTALGGTYGEGTVFEIAKTAAGFASTPTSLASFFTDSGGHSGPYGKPIVDADGNLFGTTTSGGEYGFGTVFEIAKTASGYASSPTTLVSFDSTYSSGPGDALIADAAGDLFGTTFVCDNCLPPGTAFVPPGTVFEVAKTAGGYASTPTLLHSFCSLANCADGSMPQGGLIADANGNLFGTTAFGTTSGGESGFGTVFEITGSGFVTGVPFSRLSAALIVSGGRQASFVLDSRFALGANSNGIDPDSQPVTFQVGPYMATIPAGSFRQLAAGHKLGVYGFFGKIGGASLALDVLSLGRNSYQFGAAGTPINLTTVPNPVPISLSIGSNTGSTTARARRLTQTAATAGAP
jgi:uncharacterized repeat protein (TIGR03803 family)